MELDNDNSSYDLEENHGRLGSFRVIEYFYKCIDFTNDYIDYRKTA